MMTHPAAATEEVLGTPGLYVRLQAVSKAGGGHREVRHQPLIISYCQVLDLAGYGLDAGQTRVEARVEGTMVYLGDTDVPMVHARVEARVNSPVHQAVGQGDQATQQASFGQHLKIGKISKLYFCHSVSPCVV